MGSLPPLTADAIALTEKKMDMTLDDIIKMSKKSKPKARKQRSSNKSQRPFPNKSGTRDGASKAHVQQSVSARSAALRQAKLAEMRSRNGNNQFPAVKETARRVAVARSVQWNKRSFFKLQCLSARDDLKKDQKQSTRKWVFVFADRQGKEGDLMDETIMEPLNYMKVGSNYPHGCGWFDLNAQSIKALNQTRSSPRDKIILNKRPIEEIYQALAYSGVPIWL